MSEDELIESATLAVRQARANMFEIDDGELGSASRCAAVTVRNCCDETLRAIEQLRKQLALERKFE